MEKTPHFSRIADLPESINPITGRSLYYGLRPWRCDDRFMDWLAGFTSFASPFLQYELLARVRRCSKSAFGQEPDDDYLFLTRKEVMYYAERSKSGMVREKLFETYPYDQTALRKIAEDDALKMRVWRHQRQLELEAREGKIDDALADNVLGGTRNRNSQRPPS